jgi:hypothetical protein
MGGVIDAVDEDVEFCCIPRVHDGCGGGDRGEEGGCD